MCVCGSGVCEFKHPERSEEGIRFSGAGVMGGYELPNTVLGSKIRFSIGPAALLTICPALSSPTSRLLYILRVM